MKSTESRNSQTSGELNTVTVTITLDQDDLLHVEDTLKKIVSQMRIELWKASILLRRQTFSGVDLQAADSLDSGTDDIENVLPDSGSVVLDESDLVEHVSSDGCGIPKFYAIASDGPAVNLRLNNDLHVVSPDGEGLGKLVSPSDATLQSGSDSSGSDACVSPSDPELHPPACVCNLAMLVASNVRSICSRVGYNQTDIAALLHIAQSSVSLKWRGLREWTLRELYDISTMIGIYPSMLLEPPSEW